jgi:hypothetical protein
MTKEEKINKIEELKEKASELKREVDYYNALQLALKLVLNGSYGAFAANYFVLFNNYVAGTITAQGRDLTQTMDKVNQKYWYDMWHLDTDTHEKMGIKNARQIRPDESVSIYADTDSVDGKTIVRTSSGKKTIEEWYNSNIDKPNGITLCGHESVETSDKVLNWDEKNGLYFADVKRIIRHKVSKPKWKLKTKSGKEVVVTNDHSMIVFRNGEKLEIKPEYILPSDKILTIYEN